MTGTKPTFERRVDIPALYDAQGSGASIQNAFETAHDDVERFAELRRDQDKLIADQQSVFRQQSGAAVDTGEMATTNAAANYAARESKANEDRKKNADAMERAALLNQLNEYIDDLDNQLAQFDLDIAHAEEALDAIDQLEDLHRRGEFDPDNPDHADLMRKAGVSKDDLARDPDSALGAARGRWKDRLDDLTKGRADVQRDRDRADDMRNRYQEASTPAAKEAITNEIAEELEVGDADAARLAVVTLEDNDDVAADVVTETYAEAGRSEEVLDRIADSFESEDGWGEDDFSSEYESFAETIDEEKAEGTDVHKTGKTEGSAPITTSGQFPILDFVQR